MIFIIISSVLLLLPITAAQAVPICVVCTAAVGAGVGFSRWLGVDDTITGLWLGALAVSLSFWTINWLNGKKIKFFGRQPLIFAAYYVSLVWPLYHYGIAGHPLNKLWGIDKLILGIIIGSICLPLGVHLNEKLKQKNGGRVYFPFQKVVVPVGALILISLTLYFLIANKFLQ